MIEIKERLIQRAKNKYNDICPVSGRKDLFDCFTVHDDVLFFWFNVKDENFTTRMLSHELKLRFLI